MDDSILVYSTDPERNKKCLKCKYLLEECICLPDQEWDLANIIVRIHMEKSGRKGKSVTLLQGFPKSDLELKKLSKVLKTRCGAGGTYYVDDDGGVIEIQGDKRGVVKEFLKKEGFVIKT